ncbi:MAG: hypothetical protein AB1304_09660, partial [Bacteroidota bacterium]
MIENLVGGVSIPLVPLLTINASTRPTLAVGIKNFSKWDSKRDCFVVAITPSRNDGKILLASFSKGGFKTQKIQGKQM